MGHNADEWTEARLREGVAKRLRIPDVPQPIWDFITKHHGDELDAAGWRGPKYRGDLVKIARRLLELHADLVREGEAVQGNSSRAERPTEQLPAPRAEALPAYWMLLGEQGRARMEAVTEYVAVAADARPEVQAFRKRVLGDRLLDPPDGRNWLLSPAVHALPLEVLARAGISPRNHCVRVDESPPLDGAGPIHLRFSDPDLLVRLEVEKGEHAWLFDWHDQVVHSRPGSLGTALYELARGLTHQMYGWEGRVAEAALFILTGTAPPVYPIICGYDPTSDLIRIDRVEPWLPPEVVAAFYSFARKAARQGRQRQTGLKNLQLVTFVLQQYRTQPLRRWEEVRRRWNRHQRDKAYTRSDHLSRDYNRTLDTLAPRHWGKEEE